MQDHIFRMYDIRGKVGTELIIDEVSALASALALYCIEKNGSVNTVAIGRDGRVHSPVIHKKIVASFQDAGIDVIDIGLCSTPAAYFSHYWLRVDMVVMITASHNPKDYNGIKVMLNRSCLFGDDIFSIRDLYKQNKKVETDTIGSYKKYAIIPDYVHYLKRLFPHLVGKILPIVFDCGNGAVGSLLPQLIEAFEWKGVVTQCVEVDGDYPHHEADPTVDKNVEDLKFSIKKHSSDYGIGFDGDGDRMGAVTSQGELVTGDKLLALYSKSVIPNFPNRSVVFDAKCSGLLSESIKSVGGDPQMSPSGHGFIKKTMKKYNAILAGELSCHLFFKDRYFGFDDGVYAALRLIEIIDSSEKTFDEMVALLPVKYGTSEIRFGCDQGQGPQIIDEVRKKFQGRKQYEISTLDGVRVTSLNGWGLLRSSNTQPVVCLRIEADSLDGVNEIRKEFIEALSGYYSSDYLEKIITL